MLACIVMVQASAATVNTEETYQGTSISHSPSNQAAFAVTFEVDNITLDDIATTTTPFFTWEMGYSGDKTITVQALYGANRAWSFYMNGSLGNFLMQSNVANIDDASGTYIFQFEERASGCFISFGKLDMWDDITPLVTSEDEVPLPWAQPFTDVYSNTYSGATMTEGSFTINTVNASNPVVKNVKSWDGSPTGDEIAEANKVVPEPATATLSLLALAGLAARRRRK